MIHRSGEENNGSNFFRTERYVQINELWFYLTRGGAQQGPFSSRMEAEESLRLFLAVANSNISKPTAKRRKPRLRSTSSPLKKRAKVEKAPVQVRRIEFTPVAQDVGKVEAASSKSANDSIHICTNPG